MRNTIYSQIVKEKREATGSHDCGASLPKSAASQEWCCRGHELEAALSKLPAHQREVIVLIGVLGALGESYETTAKLCDCESGTVKSRLNRARVRLATELGELSDRTIFEDDEFRSSLA